jgi:hypothetical protein
MFRASCSPGIIVILWLILSASGGAVRWYNLPPLPVNKTPKSEGNAVKPRPIEFVDPFVITVSTLAVDPDSTTLFVI